MAKSMMDFTQIINIAHQTGFFKVVIPFLLVFSIVYGVLQAIGLFKKKGINAIIAFALGMLVTGSGVFTATIKSFTPYLGIVLFFLLSFLVVLGLVTGEELQGDRFPLAIGVVGFGAVLAAFAFSQGSIGGVGGAGAIVQNNIGIILALSVIVIAIIIVMGPFGGE